MTAVSTKFAGIPPWGLAVAAMLSIQLGAALSIDLIAAVGPAGTSWLRLSIGSLIFLALARPRPRDIQLSTLPGVVGLGAATGMTSVCFLAAIERIPLGTAVAIQFLGPLSVAAVRGHNRRALTWPGLALLGIILLTEPWQGTFHAVGVGFAALAGCGLAAYIVAAQLVGDHFAGVTGLSLAMPVAAATAATLGIPQASGKLTLEVLFAAAGLAVLIPVLPFALEMRALRAMTQTAFGTLMALEPAIGLLLGMLLLSQEPSPTQLFGILFVVIAGAAAQRYGQRQKSAPEEGVLQHEPWLRQTDRF